MIKICKNYPNILISISSFNNDDYIYIKKIINELIEYSYNNKKYITVYVDTYNLKNYSLIYIYKLIKFNSNFTNSHIKFISNIELYINNKNKNIVNKFTYILQFLCPINVNINYIVKEKKWDKIFKEY